MTFLVGVLALIVFSYLFICSAKRMNREQVLERMPYLLSMECCVYTGNIFNLKTPGIYFNYKGRKILCSLSWDRMTRVRILAFNTFLNIDAAFAVSPKKLTSGDFSTGRYSLYSNQFMRIVEDKDIPRSSDNFLALLEDFCNKATLVESGKYTT